MPGLTRRVLEATARWVEPEDNPGGVVYGTIAVGAVLAAEAPRRETFASTLEATMLTLVLYWFAHTYAFVVGRRLEAEPRLSGRRVAEALVREWAIVRGAAVPIVVLGIGWLAGASLAGAVNAAVWAAAVALATWEVLAALRSEAPALRRAGEALLGFAFGGGIVLLHVLLH